MSSIDGYSCQVATLATLGAIIVTAVCLTLLLRVTRERTQVMRRFLIALGAFSLVTAFLSFQLDWVRNLGTGAMSMVLIPLLAALLAMTAAAVIAARDGTIGKRAWIAVLGELAAVGIAAFFIVTWRDLRQREKLFEAAAGGDLRATQNLMLQSKGDEGRPLRQRLLVDAASQLNLEIMRVLVTEGADVNAAALDQFRQLTTPLLAAVSARRPEGKESEAQFAMRRMRVVNFLLRRGADPQGRATPDGPTAIEAAGDASLDDVREVLEAQSLRGVGK